MDLYQGKYRSAYNRLKRWDYFQNAFYFITLITQHRECNLRQAINNEMILSDFGKINDTEWLKSFDMRHELLLDEYVIMPNHLHAIVFVQNQEKEIRTVVFVEKDVLLSLQTPPESTLSPTPSYCWVPKS
jgi:REP element-mobilizing transposase RayT